MTLSPRTWHLLTLLADGEFHSGLALAECLGVSRATVFNTLNETMALNTGLQRVRGQGYRLSLPWQMLNHAAVVEGLGETAARLRLDILQQANSSNAVLLDRLQHGAPSGSVVAVELQTAGRGRLGRTWHSGLGNALTFSVLWRFDDGLTRLAGLSLAVGVAIVRALHELGIPDVGLKWPNDLLTPQGKLGGILLEARGELHGACAVVIGIGLNHSLPPALLQRIDQPVCALNQLNAPLPNRNRLLAAVLQQLVMVLDDFSKQGFAPLQAEWERDHRYQNQPVCLTMPDGSPRRGIARGITPNGELRLETADGMRHCHSGEIFSSFNSAI